MPLVSSVNYEQKRIYLNASTVNSSLDTLEIYREVRELRRTTDSHQKFMPMIVAGGNIEKIPSVSATPPYVQLLYGCRIVPFNAEHQLRLTRDTFTDDGFAGRDCFDRSGLTFQVDIDVNVPQVEVRIVTGGSGLSNDQDQALTRIVQTIESDELLEPNQVTRFIKGTSTVLSRKAITGGSNISTVRIEEI